MIVPSIPMNGIDSVRELMRGIFPFYTDETAWSRGNKRFRDVDRREPSRKPGRPVVDRVGSSIDARINQGVMDRTGRGRSRPILGISCPALEILPYVLGFQLGVNLEGSKRLELH